MASLFTVRTSHGALLRADPDTGQVFAGTAPGPDVLLCRGRCSSGSVR